MLSEGIHLETGVHKILPDIGIVIRYHYKISYQYQGKSSHNTELEIKIQPSIIDLSFFQDTWLTM